jgi:hypothetical protein
VLQEAYYSWKGMIDRGIALGAPLSMEWIGSLFSKFTGYDNSRPLHPFFRRVLTVYQHHHKTYVNIRQFPLSFPPLVLYRAYYHLLKDVDLFTVIQTISEELGFVDGDGWWSIKPLEWLEEDIPSYNDRHPLWSEHLTLLLTTIKETDSPVLRRKSVLSQ